MRLALALLGLAAATPDAASGLTLDGCRASAERDHPRVAAARAARAAAAAREAVARAGFLPALTGDATYQAARGAGGIATRGGTSAPTLVGPADFESWGVGLTARQTIWDFGRTWSAVDAAEAGAEAAAAEERAARLTLALEAEAAFRAAAAADELVAAAEETKLRAEKHLELARARAEVGLRPKYDVTRAEVERANAELALLSATNGRSLARAQLASACGLAALPAGEAIEAPPPRAEDVAAEDVVLAAVDRRPELRAAKARVSAAEEDEAAARAQFLPSLGAAGGASYRGPAPAELGPGWTATVQLTVPILSGGADLGRVREAEARLEAARADLEDARRAVELEHREALLGAREARARVEATARLEEAAEEGLALAEGRYETGLGDVLEVADAQAALASARAARVRATLDRAVSLARLERLLAQEIER